jgi:hypothetical protein
VELQADVQTRLARNRSEDRLAAKSSKQDLKASEQRLLEAEDQYQLNSHGEFPFPHHLLIDNTDLDPGSVARRIQDHFSLPVASTDPEGRDPPPELG